MIPLFLASSSPRRSSLLRQIGWKIEVQVPDTEETQEEGEAPDALVSRLAFEKVHSIRSHVHQEEWLALGADTVVVLEGKIFGKPSDASEAIEMLRFLSGKKHEVLTGYCILHTQKKEVVKSFRRVIKTQVSLRCLSLSEIKSYVATSESLDKAGAYGVQEAGTLLVEKIEGSYTNVVGLPLSEICTDLKEVFGIPLFSWIHGSRTFF
jgi:septum formation protein